MKSDQVDISSLSDELVSSLLAMGSSKGVRGAKNAISPIELLQQAIDDPSSGKLQLLVADLKRGVLAGDGGPLSFRRLTELSDELAEEFEGKTFANMLMSDATSRQALEHLARYGEIMSGESFSRLTQLTGVVIRSLAQMALAARHEVQFISEVFATTQQVVALFTQAEQISRSGGDQQDSAPHSTR